MASLRLSTILFSFCMLCISNHVLVAAQLELLSIDYLDGDYVCDVGPDVLTNAHGKDIPRTCIDVPVGEGSTATTVERCYYTYVPESCMGDENGENPLDLPVVFDIHGLKSCALFLSLYSGWKEKAEEECFVVVWPSGNVNDGLLINGCWNLPAFLRDEGYGTEGGNNVTTSPCCCFKSDDETGLPPKEPNDPLFLRMAIDSVAESFDMESSNYYGSISIDRSRVYMAGHSNGCITSLSMAALHSDVVAAACCHAGTLLTPFPEQYTPVPIWMAHGLKDDIMKADGNVFFDLGPLFGKLGYWSTNDVLDYIGGRNDCREAETADIGESGATYRRTNCTNSADVELVMLYESGHFPYAPLPNNISSYFVLNAPVDTTAMAWEFCSSYSNPQQQGYPSGDDSLENENEIDDDAGEPGENEKEHKKPESDAVPVKNKDANNANAVEDNEEAMDPLLSSSAPRWRSMHDHGTILSATVMALVLVLGCVV